MEIKVRRLHPDAKVPLRANETDAGYDIVAVEDGEISASDAQGEYIEYKTGISIEPPAGYHVEIFPRSSISKTDLLLANSIGLIDNGYRGEIRLRFKFANNSRSEQPSLIYHKGDKIGQLVIRKTESLSFIEVDELSGTERGEGGFGSTGN